MWCPVVGRLAGSGENGISTGIVECTKRRAKDRQWKSAENGRFSPEKEEEIDFDV